MFVVVKVWVVMDVVWLGRGFDEDVDCFVGMCFFKLVWVIGVVG